MKNSLFLFLLITFTSSVSAQFLLGGQFNLHHSKSEPSPNPAKVEASVTQIKLLPRLTYIRDHIWYGADVGISFLNLQVSSAGKRGLQDQTIQFSMAPFARYMYRPIKRLGVWAEAQLGGYIGISRNYTGRRDELYGFHAGLRPGLIVFITSRLSLETSFGFVGFRVSSVQDEYIKNTEYASGFSFNTSGQFGFNWQF